ncbi:MAG: nuclear transport factor 2 family protein [Chloroflexi bacterium]|nr:nuclear transport factor 2 family protein [Chloroflexota bacterium]
MGSQENIKVVQDLIQANRDRDEARLSQLLTEDAVIRVAGVPRALGGVTQGRDQILANLREQGPAGQAEIRSIFADDNNVCAVLKVSGPFTGSQHFRGSDRPFSTYECIVYGLDGGRIKDQTVYMNFLDVYVQAGLVPLNSLTAQG